MWVAFGCRTTLSRWECFPFSPSRRTPSKMASVRSRLPSSVTDTSACFSARMTTSRIVFSSLCAGITTRVRFASPGPLEIPVILLSSASLVIGLFFLVADFDAGTFRTAFAFRIGPFFLAWDFESGLEIGFFAGREPLAVLCAAAVLREDGAGFFAGILEPIFAVICFRESLNPVIS